MDVRVVPLSVVVDVRADRRSDFIGVVDADLFLDDLVAFDAIASLEEFPEVRKLDII